MVHSAVSGKSAPGSQTVAVTEKAPPSIRIEGDLRKTAMASSHKRKILPEAGEDVSSYITFPPCTHLSKVLASAAGEAVIKTYNSAIKICLMEPPQPPTTKRRHHGDHTNTYFHHKGEPVSQRELFRARAKILRCKDCHAGSSLVICLHCPNVACSQLGHAQSHAKSSSHIFGVNTNTGQLICFKCGDIVGHPLLERIRVANLREKGMLSTYPGVPVFGKERSDVKESLVEAESRLPTFKASRGLKGFINMGSTCFMSSILQVMVHNPYIRDYYMSGSHLDCPKETESCISCCVGEILKDFYTSTNTSSFGPSSLLCASWKVKKSLAGYSEQDAHEFWQFLIQQLHKNDTKRKNRELTPTLESDGGVRQHGSLFSCECITHRTFAGELQSTLTCEECGNERVTVDPMLDWSLEIQDKRKPLKNVDECLQKFTRPEKLDILQQCDKCGKKAGVIKQLKIRKLPPTLCIQLKRFEHLAVSTKIDAHIDAPLILDMSKYTRDGRRNGDTGSELYELYAVVYHIGSVSTGHYISLVKDNNGMWFKFDDSHVVRISEQEVLKAQAYLLFYIIHELP